LPASHELTAIIWFLTDCQLNVRPSDPVMMPDQPHMLAPLETSSTC